MWYASPGNQGWGNKSLSRKPSVLEADVAPSAANALKPSAGRVIRIINNLDHTVQVSMKEINLCVPPCSFLNDIMTMPSLNMHNGHRKP